jgi:hypothetical protein
VRELPHLEAEAVVANSEGSDHAASMSPHSATFLHFTSWDPEAVSAGQVYATPKDQSHYWNNKLRAEWARDAARQELSANLGLPDTLLAMLADQFFAMKYSAELLKEYVFEEVRSAEFSALPSRRRCMFLFADYHTPDAYARILGYPEGQHSLIRVRPKPSAVLHVADMRHLNCNTKDHAGLVIAARQYWGSADPSDINSEVLLEGEWELEALVAAKRSRVTQRV